MKGEYIVTEAIYKVGDILEIPGNVVLPRQFGMFPKEETCRCLVLNVLHPGFDSISYTFLTHKDGFGTFNIIGVGHANITDCAKLIGHCDISALRYEKPEEAENAMLKSQIACMEGRIESLAQKRDQLDADNRYLSAKVKHLTNSNNSLQANLAEETSIRERAEAELHEKIEELDGVYHSDIVCENNRLRNENRILNEIVNGFKSTCANCEARSENERLRAENNALSNTLSKSEAKAQSRLDRDGVLKRENEELRGYNKELEQALSKSKEENSKLAQKISCADNLLAEAANRLYQGRAHLNISAHN